MLTEDALGRLLNRVTLNQRVLHARRLDRIVARRATAGLHTGALGIGVARGVRRRRAVRLVMAIDMVVSERHVLAGKDPETTRPWIKDRHILDPEIRHRVKPQRPSRRRSTRISSGVLIEGQAHDTNVVVSIRRVCVTE